MDRRFFTKKLIGWLAAVLVLFGLGGLAYRFLNKEKTPLDDIKEIGTGPRVINENEQLEEIINRMPKRRLGKTEFSVSLFSLGGESTIELKNKAAEAEEIINRAIDLGVNYIDTAPVYGNGGSESNIGRVMEYRRKEVFLATKTLERSYDGTMRAIEESLKRLQTDYLDLYQIHNIRTSAELEAVFSEYGAVKAMETLKEQGVIRYTGITGHKDPDVLLQGITQYNFDCLLMFLNAGDIHYEPFQEKLLYEAVKLDMGIIAMKVAAQGRIFNKHGIATMKQALDYVYSFPISTAIVGITSLDHLEENVLITTEFEKLSLEEIKHLEYLAKPYANEANLFKHH